MKGRKIIAEVKEKEGKSERKRGKGENRVPVGRKEEARERKRERKRGRERGKE